MGVQQFQEYLYPDLGRDSLKSQEHIGIGDVEIGAKFLVVDRPMTATRRRSLMVSVASSVQLPTGSRETRGEQIDLALGEGSLVIDSRLYVDGRIGRFGLLAAGEFAFKPNDKGFEPNLGVRSELLGSSTQMTQAVRGAALLRVRAAVISRIVRVSLDGSIRRRPAHRRRRQLLDARVIPRGDDEEHPDGDALYAPGGN